MKIAAIRCFWCFIALISIALFAVWGRSYWHMDAPSYRRAVPWRGDTDALAFGICCGVVDVQHEELRIRPIRREQPVKAHWEFLSWHLDPALRSGFLSMHPNEGPFLLWAFGILKEDKHTDFGFGDIVDTHVHGFYFPIWVIALPLNYILVSKVRRVLRFRRRIRSGLCTNCGYDLRASEGRCPECGQSMTRAGEPQLPANAAGRDGDSS